jgi:hypothetical protein
MYDRVLLFRSSRIDLTHVVLIDFGDLLWRRQGSQSPMKGSAGRAPSFQEEMTKRARAFYQRHLRRDGKYARLQGHALIPFVTLCELCWRLGPFDGLELYR